MEELETEDTEYADNEIRDLSELVANHNWHIEKLEMITRVLDNHAVGF